MTDLYIKKISATYIGLMTIDLHYVNYNKDQQPFTLIRKLSVHHLIGNPRKYLEIPWQIYHGKDKPIRMKLLKIVVDNKQFDPNSYESIYEMKKYILNEIEATTNGK